MRVHIVVEGFRDKLLLDILLEDLANSCPFHVEPANGKDAARPIARKYLVKYREPACFVYDSETTDQFKVQEQVAALKDYFSWHSGGTPFGVFPMVPMMEIIFFERPLAIKKRMGDSFLESSHLAWTYAPKQVLETNVLPKLGLSSFRQFVSSLQPNEIADLRGHQNIIDIRRFIEESARGMAGGG